MSCRSMCGSHNAVRAGLARDQQLRPTHPLKAPSTHPIARLTFDVILKGGHMTELSFGLLGMHHPGHLI